MFKMSFFLFLRKKKKRERIFHLQMQQTACRVIELHDPADIPPALRHSPFKTHVPNNLFLPSHGVF